MDKSNNMNNPYEGCKLRPKGLKDAPVKEPERVNIYNDGNERIDVLLACVSDGGGQRWLTGFQLATPDYGEKNHLQLPNLKDGYSETRREAMLYALGRLWANNGRFSKEARIAIMRALNEQQQLNIFDNGQ